MIKRAKRPAQTNRLLQYLEKHKRGVTQKEAMEKLGIGRLGGRVYDLRQMGYPIHTQMISVNNRFGDKTMVARYVLQETKK